MAPNLVGESTTPYMEAAQHSVHQEKSGVEKINPQKLTEQNSLASPARHPRQTIVWKNVIAFLYLHIGAMYGLYLTLTAFKFYTILWVAFGASCTLLGITAGSHRLWTHRAYKAKWPLRLMLMVFQTAAFQNHIYEWARDHRVHHKYTDTNADPHNVQRGFFYSHVGWLLVRKHPDVLKKGARIDMSDLEKDPIVVWQKRWYSILMPLLCFIIPTWIPCYFWDEKPLNAWYSTLLRYALILNVTWLVNSAAHIWGMKPYDKKIRSTENIGVAIAAFGEGWHNYHHVFPWDYKAAELGNYRMNVTTAFIDFFGRIGWAYDMKIVPSTIVQKHASRSGDGSKYKTSHEHADNHKGAQWGWGDKDIETEEIKGVEIINKCD